MEEVAQAVGKVDLEDLEGMFNFLLRRELAMAVHEETAFLLVQAEEVREGAPLGRGSSSGFGSNWSHGSEGEIGSRQEYIEGGRGRSTSVPLKSQSSNTEVKISLSSSKSGAFLPLLNGISSHGSHRSGKGGSGSGTR